MFKSFLLVSILAFCFLNSIHAQNAQTFSVGFGIYDITGPAAETGMMGYATASQTTAGLHFRLRARALIVADSNTNKRFCFVNVDGGMVFSSVTTNILAALELLYPGVYDAHNVMLSGTHTHSGPAGFSYFPLYNIMSLGFIESNFETIASGIVAAIKMAHSNVQPSISIGINWGILMDSNINRSPTAYLFNPAEERAQYEWNTDKNMTLLNFVNSKKQSIGIANWFSVHGTSMNNTNQLISGDNKGYAEYLFEKKMNGPNVLPGIGPFVAIFGQSNEGDVSPNTRGAFCPDGTPCDNVNSICPSGKEQDCVGMGPGVDMFDSTKIIGTNQFEMAWNLYNNVSQYLSGPIDYIHTYVNMKHKNVSSRFTNSGQEERTCHGSLGDAFAAGTTDGCGDFDFRQGTNSSKTNPFWNWLSDFALSNPTKEEIACQAPKPILLNVGDITFPCPWAAELVAVQIFRIGNFFLIGVPGEFTTMAGRRLRNTVRQALVAADPTLENATIVIAGLSNEYTHYITTYEEYQEQRYEGASNLFGPNALAAYQDIYYDLAYTLASGNSSAFPPGPTPPDMSKCTFSFQPPVIFDAGSFGKVYQDVNPTYNVGDLVKVVFYGANPRNDYRTQDTFLTVEMNQQNNWVTVLNDGDWDTIYRWQRHGIAESLITITWNITTAEPGTYRIRHFGNSKSVFGKITPYVGVSSSFVVNA